MSKSGNDESSRGSRSDESGQGSRLDAARMEYLRRLEYDRNVDRVAWEAEILARYADIAVELKRFFENRRRVSVAMPRVQASAAALSSFPRLFANYRLLREIGRGGMGVVYEARQLSPDRTVAVKMILSGQLASQKDVARFQREAQTAAELQHPNIVTIFEVGEYRKCHFFAMEYVKGESLDRKIRSNTMTSRQAASYVQVVAEAMAYAHDRGNLHRDLKPSNILIDERGQPKITDFGLSRRLKDDQKLTLTGELLGTPSYMSPEQADEKEPGPTSDVYSLGAVLYELLTGRPPFQAESLGDTLWMVRHKEPIEPSRLNAKTPRDLETVCLKCLEKDPQKRYQTAKDLADDLGRFLRGEPVKARRIGSHERAWRWCRRNPVVAGLLAAVLVTTLFGAGGVLWQLRETRKALADTRKAEALRILAQLESLLTSEPESVPAILENLKPFRAAAVPRLREVIQQPSLAENRRIRAALGLLPDDPSQAAYLREKLLELEPREFQLVLAALARNHERLAPELWGLVDDATLPKPRRFRAACALATFDPDPARWEKVSADVVAGLVAQEPILASHWMEAFRPVRSALLGPLAQIFRDSRRGEAEKVVATSFLAEFAADLPATLVDLIQDANPWQFSALIPRLERRRDEIVKLLNSRLDSRLPDAAGLISRTGAVSPSSEDAKDTHARRQANVAVALLRLGSPESVWPLFKHGEDPRLRTYLIHKLAAMEVDPGLIVDRFGKEPDVSARRGLLLCMGEYQAAALPTALRQRLTSRLTALYRDDPDPGIHSAIDWLLSRWGREADVVLIDSQVQSIAAGGEKRWYVNSQGYTMAIIPGPVEFAMGARASEAPTSGDFDAKPEPWHRRRIPRTFAIATKETRAETFDEFLKETKVLHYRVKTFSPDPNGPMGNVNWHEAALYCRWLSEKVGVPEDQMCYKPLARTLVSGTLTGQVESYPDHLSRTGYRLPTEAEWEYACRAGSLTSRFYGNDENLIEQYAWVLKNSRERASAVGRLKPNDLGLFDTYGNVSEWCQDSPAAIMMLSHVLDLEKGRVIDDTLPSNAGPFRPFRGGSYATPILSVRSAARAQTSGTAHDHSVGFRVARTMSTPGLRSLQDIAKIKPTSGTLSVLIATSYDELAGRARYLVGLADDVGMQQRFENAMSAIGKEQSLGINRVGVLLESDGTDIYPIAFRPFESEEQAIEVTKRFFANPQRLSSGVHRMSDDPPLFMRFDRGYGYLASSPQQLAGRLPEPQKLVSSQAKQYDVALTIRPEYIGNTYRSMLQQYALEQIVADCEEVVVGLQISSKTRTGVLDVSVRAKSRTALADALDGLNRGQNRFADLQDPRSAVNLSVTVHPNASLGKILAALIEESRVQELAHGANVSIPNDQAARNAFNMTEVWRIVGDSITKDGMELNASFARDESGLLSLSTVGHFKNAKTLSDLFTQLQSKVHDSDPKFGAIKNNVEQYKGWIIHEINMVSADPLSKLLYGPRQTEHVAFGQDAIVSFLARDSKSSSIEVKRLIDRLSAPVVSRHDAAPIELRISLAQFLPFIDAAEVSSPDAIRLLSLARKCFVRADQAHLTLDHIPDGIRLRLELEEGYLRFLIGSIADKIAKSANK